MTMAKQPSPQSKSSFNPTMTSSLFLTKRVLLRCVDRQTASSPCRTLVVLASHRKSPVVSNHRLIGKILSPSSQEVVSSSPLNIYINNNCRWNRCFSSSGDDVKKALDEFQELFVEARMCIEDVTESVGTKYFDEDAEAAQEAVDEAVGAFEKLIGDIENPDEKNRILRGNGLKVEQLKGELEMALKGGHDH